MRGFTALVLGAALLASAPAGAWQQGAGEDPREAHARADQNHDGVVDHREYSQRLVDVFYFADANHDGYLTESEYVATDLGSFESSDLNDDGKVTLPELLQASVAIFDAADTDDDGTLSLDEVVAYDRSR